MEAEMDEGVSQAFTYSYISVVALGIFGNILVIISILRQRKLLQNNYYFLVLHLAICDLGCLVMIFSRNVTKNFAETIHDFVPFCLVVLIDHFFAVARVYMMLIVAVVRYRVTVHPLKPKISRRKFKIACGLIYFLSFITGYAAFMPLCIMQLNYAKTVYEKYYKVYVVSCFYLLPTALMSVIYSEIGRALIKQTKRIKHVCSNAVRSRYVRNRRTFLVCLGTAFCFAVGAVPSSVCILMSIAGVRNHPVWFIFIGEVLRIAGSHVANPFIYGIFDKRMLVFWKLCSSR